MVKLSYWLLLCCCICSTIGQNAVRETKLQSITTLAGNCASGGNVCRNFQFADASVVAFFDLKAEIRINSESTYELESPLPGYDKLIFENSTFINFPLHLFDSMELKELDIRNCSVKNISWESFLMANELRVLLLSNNKIHRIDESTFQFASALQYLFLDSNQLRTLVHQSFQGLDKLRYLDLSNNRLRELPHDVFAKLPELQELILAQNHLYHIGNELFAWNPMLHTIRLTGNRLDELSDNAFRTQTRLALLDLSHNERLETLVVGLEARYLVAANCSLYRVNIYGAVDNVDLHDNRIIELYFAQPESLLSLNLRNNALQQIASLARVVKLQFLDLGDNPGMAGLPVPWTVDSLERLDLSNTSLSVFPFDSVASQPNLRSLNVSNNKLREINPRNFVYLENLTHFYIHANDWNCFNLNMLMDLLIRPRGISYRHDIFDIDFPGEYINGIACMYRLDDEAEDDAEPTAVNSYNEFQQQQQQNQQEALTDPTTTKAAEEILALRKELKAIMSFYETKFDKAFNLIENLNARLSEFEQFNGTIWQHVTIST